MEAALSFIISALILVGIVCLQISLSKKENKWLGLIIPLVFFLFSIMSVLGYSMYSTTTSTSVLEAIDGVIVNKETIEAQTENLSNGEILTTIIPVFIVTNIPTLVFLIIYSSFRKKKKKNLELQKMNIQDLE